MADQTIKLGIQVDSNGSTDREITKAEKLRASLEKASKTASSMGGTSGSRGVASGYRAEMSGQEYGTARGITARTGASARDFANESQGLGGLVRLYATYAANVFAVGAAFRALSEAMDTSNMIRGLDQLGASTGVAMGGLAKKFAEASGGAISLRESMEATAKAMSSGMSQKQFLVLGEVAKKASQALGVGMSDAVSRLTRGITKLEPELLDELGLFTKVGKASEDYARVLGKSVDNLTDFEKRQAFANAVLKEGIDKFKDIDIPTNPYDKLLASLKNVSQTMLDLVNKALTPLVGFLSQSPTALTAVIAGLGGLILKQALPIFSNYRAEMEKATAQMQKLAEAKADSARKSLEIARQAKAAEVKLELDKIAQIRTEQVDAAQKALEATSKSGLSKKVKGILAKPEIMSITDKDLELLDKLGEKQTKVSAKYKQLAEAIREAQAANTTFFQKSAELERKKNAPAAFGTAAYAAEQKLESYRRQAAGAALVSKVGATVSEAGTIAATKELISGISTQKLGLIRGGLTGISGAASILAGTMGNLMAVFSKFFGYLAVAGVVFELLDFAFSKNSKQLEAFNTALSSGEDSVKAATETYKKFGEQLVPQNIIASSQALNNIADSMKAVTDSLREADASASGWDRFIDGFKSLWGGDLKSKYTESIIPQVVSGLNSIRDPNLRKDAENTIKSLLKTTDISATGMSKALEEVASEDIVQVGTQLEEVLSKIGATAQKSAGNLISVQDGFKALETSYANLANTLNLNDQLSLFGKDLATQGFRLAEAFKDPVAAASALRDIITDTSKLKLLAPETQASLMANKQSVVDLTNQLTIYEKELASINKELQKSGLSKSQRGTLESSKSQVQSLLVGIQEKLFDLAKSMTGAITPSIDKGFALLQGGFERAVAMANLSYQKGLVDMLPKTGTSVKLSADLENQKLDIQINQLKETRNLIKEMELSRISSERIHLEDQRDRALASTTEPNLRAGIERTANEKIKVLSTRENILKSSSIANSLKTGELEKTPETLKALEQELGASAKIQELMSQKQLNNIKAIAEARTVDADNEAKQLQDAQRQYTSVLALQKSSSFYRELDIDQQYILNESYAEANDFFTKRIAIIEAEKAVTISQVVLDEARKIGNQKIAEAAQASLNIATEHLTKTKASAESTAEAAKSERARTFELAKQANMLTLATIQLDKQNQIRKLSTDTEDKISDIRKQELEYLFQNGKVSIEKYSEEIQGLEATKLLRQKNNSLLDAQYQLTVDLIALNKEYNETTDATKREETRSRMDSRREIYDEQVAGIDSVYNAQYKLLTQQNEMSERQKGYADIVKNSFSSMADALVEWAKTGKLSSRDLFNSLIADLARYELRLQMLRAYESFKSGGSSLLGSLGALMGSGGQAAFSQTSLGSSGFGTGLAYGNMDYGAFFANGGAFEAGLQKFAKGDAFTNSIVSNPTLFKFAQGTGLMGEAGPEAIMPLKRDSNGNLGVRASGSETSVQVVVNNHTGQPATTVETQDSRGNKKIEVLVGELVAREVSRPNSPVNTSMKNNFQVQPTLIRR